MSELYQETEDGTEVFYSEIHRALCEFIEDRGIEDMAKESQNKWNAALIYIYNTVFKGKNILKLEPYDSNNLQYGSKSNNNAYDLKKVNAVCDMYIYLCYDYEKEISIKGFCKMTGITESCIYAWAGNSGYSEGLMNRASDAGVEIRKKLNEENEESLSALLISGKRPPVAILGALNKRHGWNMGQPQEVKQGLPDQSAADIAARHRIGQEERPELPEDI